MKRISILFVGLFGVILVVYFLGFWVSTSDERLIKKEHAPLLHEMKQTFEDVIADPSCPYGINKMPSYGSIPECDNAMSIYDDNRLITLHSARVMYIDYDVPSGIHRDYVVRIMENFFIKHSFLNDNENTRIESIWSDEYKRYKYVFRRDNLSCYWYFISLNENGLSDVNPTSVTIGCGTLTKEDERIYDDFRNIVQSYQPGDTPYQLTRLEGNFGSLSVGAVSSVSFLLKKVNGIWTAPLGPSQEYPMCAEVEQLDFPRSIYDNCMLKDYSLKYKL